MALHRSGLSQYLHTALSASAGVQLGTDDYSSAVDYASNPAIETGMVLSRSAGGVYLFDHDGVLRYAKDNEIPFVNLRRAENLVTASEYSSYAGSALGTTPPALANTTLFGVPCFSITLPSGAGTYGASRYTDVLTFTASTSKKYSARAKLSLSRPLTGSEEIKFRLFSNTADIIYPVINAGHVANVTGSWVDLGGNAKTPTGATLALEVWASVALTSALTVYVANINVFDSSGSGVLAPHENVSVGVLSAPYHGAGVDGVKYFATTNGNTVNASTYILTEAAGTALTSGAALIEGQATNLLAAADYRDFSVWTPTGVTMEASTPTGIDGATLASGKNEIKENTANSEHRLLRAFTAATAAKQSQMIAVKRGSGTRHIRLRLHNSVDVNYGQVDYNLDTLAIIGSLTGNYSTAYIKGDYIIIELVATNVTTGAQNFIVNMHNGTTHSYTGDGTSTLILDWAQVVTDGKAQSHVQGAATRYTSFISRPWIGATINFWIYVDFYVKFSAQALTVASIYPVSIYFNTSNYVIARLVGSSGVMRIGSNNAASYQEADSANTSCDRGDNYRMVVSYDQVNGLRMRLSNNGAAALTASISTNKAPIAALSSGSKIYLGSYDGATASTAIHAEYKNYKIGTGVLTTAQMAELVGI